MAAVLKMKDSSWERMIFPVVNGYASQTGIVKNGVSQEHQNNA
jgi:hypothetical protein